MVCSFSRLKFIVTLRRTTILFLTGVSREENGEAEGQYETGNRVYCLEIDRDRFPTRDTIHSLYDREGCDSNVRFPTKYFYWSV